MMTRLIFIKRIVAFIAGLFIVKPDDNQYLSVADDASYDFDGDDFSMAMWTRHLSDEEIAALRDQPTGRVYRETMMDAHWIGWDMAEEGSESTTHFLIEWSKDDDDTGN